MSFFRQGWKPQLRNMGYIGSQYGLYGKPKEAVLQANMGYMASRAGEALGAQCLLACVG